MSRISNLTDSLLPQPSSFSKKKQYEILDVLGTGSFGKVMVRHNTWLLSWIRKSEPMTFFSWMEQAAKWRVPVTSVNNVPGSGGADSKVAGTPASPSSLTVPSPGGRKSSSSSVVSKGSKNAEDSGVVRDVALKIIPKKKVKGNEAAVWGEMEVLKGLDHGNIVRVAQPLIRLPPHAFSRSSSTSGSSQGPNTISPSSLPRAESFLNGFLHEESSPSSTRFSCYGK